MNHKLLTVEPFRFWCQSRLIINMLALRNYGFLLSPIYQVPTLTP